MVSYVYAKLVPPYTAEEMEKKLKLDPEEVGAAAWFDRDMIKAVVEANDEHNEAVSARSSTNHFK